MFRTFQDQVPKKMCNMIGFDTDTSLACLWRVPNSNPIRNKYKTNQKQVFLCQGGGLFQRGNVFGEKNQNSLMSLNF